MSYKKRFIRNDFETSLKSVKIKKQKLYIRDILRNGFPRITSQQGNFKKRVAQKNQSKTHCLGRVNKKNEMFLGGDYQNPKIQVIS